MEEFKIYISRVPTRFTEEIVQRILEERFRQQQNELKNSGVDDDHANLVSKVELIYPRDQAQSDEEEEAVQKDKDLIRVNKSDDVAPVKEHRRFGFVYLSSKQALESALQLQTVKGGKTPTSTKLYTMHLRPYQERPANDGTIDESDHRDVCYLWSLHRCPYGEDCKFRHEGPGGCRHDSKESDSKERQRKRNGKCFAYKKGKCDKGDKCPFSHDFEPIKTQKTSSNNENDSKQPTTHSSVPKSEKDCINWKTKGKCRKRDQCPYRHDPQLHEKVLARKRNKKRSREDDISTGETSNGHNKKQKQPLSVRVFGLSYSCTEDDVRNLFQDCGIIHRILFPTFEDSGRSKGYCGVWFASPKAAEKAVQMLDGSQFQGRWLRIQSGKSMELKEWESLHHRKN